VKPETLIKVAIAFCAWTSIACALASAYCLILAPIEYVVLGIILFGVTIGLQLIRALLTRDRNAQGNDQPGGADTPAQ
jgi:hypothetical protein